MLHTYTLTRVKTKYDVMCGPGCLYKISIKRLLFVSHALLYGRPQYVYIFAHSNRYIIYVSLANFYADSFYSMLVCILL